MDIEKVPNAIVLFTVKMMKDGYALEDAFSELFYATKGDSHYLVSGLVEDGTISEELGEVAYNSIKQIDNKSIFEWYEILKRDL